MGEMDESCEDLSCVEPSPSLLEIATRDFGGTIGSFNTYCIVNNIPSTYHSADLRDFFSDFLESWGFECFHFIHRVERQVDKTKLAAPEPENVLCDGVPRLIDSATFCCVICVRTSRLYELMRTYNGKQWLDPEGGQELPSKCFISTILVTAHNPGEVLSKRPRRNAKSPLPNNQVEFTGRELDYLAEMKPPPMMRKGNVGTPTKAFVQMARKWRNSPKQLANLYGLVKRMRIEFPEDDDDDDDCGEEQTENDTSDDVVPGVHKLFAGIQELGANVHVLLAEKVKRQQLKQRKKLGERLRNQNNKVKVTNKRNQKNKLIASNVTCKEPDNTIGSFEKHTKGIGRKLLEKLGWKDGDGLGKTVKGIASALDNDGQSPKDRTGLGFEKIHMPSRLRRARNRSKATVDAPLNGKTKKLQLKQQKNLKERLQNKKNKKERFQTKKNKLKNKGTNKLKEPDNTIGAFEKHTKGIGRRLLEKQGWKDGDGLGKTVKGIASALLKNGGQNPKNKMGLGFEKNFANMPSRRRTRNRSKGKANVVAPNRNGSPSVEFGLTSEIKPTFVSVDSPTQLKPDIVEEQHLKEHQTATEFLNTLNDTRRPSEYKNGIGRKIMEKHGWKDGDGLGKGMMTPLESHGTPSNKRGVDSRSQNTNYSLARDLLPQKRFCDKSVVYDYAHDDESEHVASCRTDEGKLLTSRRHGSCEQNWNTSFSRNARLSITPSAQSPLKPEKREQSQQSAVEQQLYSTLSLCNSLDNRAKTPMERTVGFGRSLMNPSQWQDCDRFGSSTKTVDLFRSKRNIQSFGEDVGPQKRYCDDDRIVGDNIRLTFGSNQMINYNMEKRPSPQSLWNASYEPTLPLRRVHQPIDSSARSYNMDMAYNQSPRTQYSSRPLSLGNPNRYPSRHAFLSPADSRTIYQSFSSNPDF